MKQNRFFAFIFCILVNNVYAQIPQAISYQAIARNAAGAAIVNSNISIRISIKDLSASGTTIYIETHAVTTNQFGLFTLSVGSGAVVSGTFSSILWATGAKYMKVEMDPTGGTSYIDMGTSQLISVPYALVAGSVINGGSSGDDWGTQTAITNSTLSGNGLIANPLAIAQQGAASGDVLKWNGTTWAPATDNVGSGADNWGTQTVVSNSTLTGAGTFANPLGLSQQGAVTGQTLKWNGITWAPANDDDQQTISLVGNNLSISNGNTVTLPTGTTYTAGTGISISGNVITNTGDSDNNPTNEWQTLSLAGNTLSISNGNSVTLPSGGGADNWGTQSAVTDATLTGNGTAGNPLGIAQQSATTGQVLQWNGTTWAPGPSALVTGQTVSAVYSTTALSVTSLTTTWTLIPGLTQTINVPSGYTLLISTNGGIQTTSAVATGFSAADIAIFIDGGYNTAGIGYERIIAANTTGLVGAISYWSISQPASVAPGTHTIEVKALYNLGASCAVAADNNSVLHSILTLTLIKN